MGDQLHPSLNYLSKIMQSTIGDNWGCPRRTIRAEAAILRPRSRAFLSSSDPFDAARTAMGRFASTVAYYESARPPMARLLRHCRAELGFDRSQRLLDVGAGPGFSRSALRLIAAKWSASIRSRRWSRPPGRRPRRAGVAASFIEGASRIKRRASARSTSSRSAGRSTGSIPGLPEKPSTASSSRSAGFSSATPRASTTAATLASRPLTRSATAGGTIALTMIATSFSPADRLSRAGRSASRRLPLFPSNASPTASCRCRPRRRNGSATTCLR